MTNLLRRIAVAGPDDCWPWLGAIDKDGYPLGKVDGKMRRFHRAIYELFVGPIPPGFTIDHECHNRDSSCPGGRKNCLHRRCCNPGHLVARTSADNARRSPTWGGNKLACKLGHPFTPENTYRTPTTGGRQCQVCRVRRRLEWRQRKAA